jgi:signal transduction histidine kinase
MRHPFSADDGHRAVAYRWDMRTGRALGIRGTDLALAAALAGVQIAGSYLAARGQPERHGVDVAAILLLAAGPAVLLVWRRHVVPALAVVVAITLAYLLADYPFGPVILSVIAALSAAVVAGHRLAAWVGAGVLYAGHFGGLALLDRAPGVTLAGLIGVAAWLLVVLAGAELVRVRRERRLEAERMRQEEALRRVGEERLRIARELHDVLAHNISLINVQAGVALHLIDERPEQARTALAAIKEASADVLGEVRATLGVLRGVDEAAPRHPAPSLRGLDELAARVSAAGLEVRTEITGIERALPVGVDQAAFRIVQEALTNVQRHSGARAATVHVGYGEHDLTIAVDDDGIGSPADGAETSGSGILGMRERAAALGGGLDAGPRPGGGFRVRARLPLEGRS